MPAIAGRLESVHLMTFPEAKDILGELVEPDPKQAEDWKTLRAVRELVLKGLEEARNQKMIGANLQAKIALQAADPVYSVLERYKGDLRYIFIVSAVELHRRSGDGSASAGVEVSKAPGTKCERCWNYSTHVGENAEYPTICERCSAVLKEITAGV